MFERTRIIWTERAFNALRVWLSLLVIANMASMWFVASVNDTVFLLLVACNLTTLIPITISALRTRR